MHVRPIMGGRRARSQRRVIARTLIAMADRTHTLNLAWSRTTAISTVRVGHASHMSSCSDHLAHIKARIACL